MEQLTVRQWKEILDKVDPKWLDTPLVVIDGGAEVHPVGVQYRALTNWGPEFQRVDRVAITTREQAAAWVRPPAWLGPQEPPKFICPHGHADGKDCNGVHCPECNVDAAAKVTPGR